MTPVSGQYTSRGQQSPGKAEKSANVLTHSRDETFFLSNPLSMDQWPMIFKQIQYMQFASKFDAENKANRESFYKRNSRNYFPRVLLG